MLPRLLTLALQTLPVESIEERAAVVAPRQALVALGCESVRHVHLEADLRVWLKVKMQERRVHYCKKSDATKLFVLLK